MRSILSDILRSFSEGLFPPKCHVCGAFFKNQSKGGKNSSQLRFCGCRPDASTSADIFKQILSPYLCSRCIHAYTSVESPICPCCGKMFAGRNDEDHWCGDCLKHGRKYRRARSVGVYDGPLLTLIHRLKYNGRSELARPLGQLLYHAYTRHWSAGDIDWIIPVPLHPRKRRRRGFNQAHLLVAGWPPCNAGAGDQDRIDIRADILQRVRFTASQTGLGRQARQRNINGAFKIKTRARLQKEAILLIDDVFTTGATVTECAKVLLDGGADQVDVLTLARTGG